jgi:hypothetical protein
LLRKVVEVVEVAEAKVVQLLIGNIGRTKHASLAVRRDTHHRAARNWQSPMTMTAPA